MDPMSNRAKVVVYVELNFVIHIPKKNLKIKMYFREKNLTSLVPNLGQDLMNLS